MQTLLCYRKSKTIIWGSGMNLIEKLGLAMVEAIASCLLTTANNPEYFCLDPKQYFNVVNGVVCFYDDDERQFFEYKPLAQCDFEYVSIADLRNAIADHDRTDDCTDIRNHISPLTGVIER